MKIACIGWGSLIWDPKGLPIRRNWYSDGPILPVEFLRQSRDGRLTLVLSNNATPVRTLWALMATGDLEIAKDSLRDREGISRKNLDSLIGFIKSDSNNNNGSNEVIIRKWLKSKNLDAAIWTNLPAEFKGEKGKGPSEKEAIDYLRNLSVEKQNIAKEYIRKSPQQIDTDIRRRLETEFGWDYLDV